MSASPRVSKRGDFQESSVKKAPPSLSATPPPLSASPHPVPHLVIQHVPSGLGRGVVPGPDRPRQLRRLVLPSRRVRGMLRKLGDSLNTARRQPDKPRRGLLLFALRSVVAAQARRFESMRDSDAFSPSESFRVVPCRKLTLSPPTSLAVVTLRYNSVVCPSIVLPSCLSSAALSHQ